MDTTGLGEIRPRVVGDVSVVVTGLGTTSPLGGDVSSTWSGALAGRSGVRLLTEAWVEQLPVHIAAPAAVDPKDALDRVDARRLDRTGQFAVVAAREAWRDAGLGTTAKERAAAAKAARQAAGEDAGDADSPSASTSGGLVDPDRLGVVIASGIGGVTTLLDGYDTLLARGPRRVGALTVPMLMPNGPAAAVSIELGAQAGVHTPVSACASGAEAIAYALDMIRCGRADVVVAGGTEAAIHALPMAAFANMMAMSKRNDEPERASRPFDKGRDGFVLGEGGAVLVLESAEHARARGARAYCELAGAGMSSDGWHIAQPEPEGRGVARALALALADGRITPEEVKHVNAHATSTPVGDAAESKALHWVLGDVAGRIPVSATKSMTGHLLGAAGAVEAVLTVMAIRERMAPPTINLDNKDDEIDLNVVGAEPQPLPDGPIVALDNSFGFGGHNIVLAFRSAG